MKTFARVTGHRVNFRRSPEKPVKPAAPNSNVVDVFDRGTLVQLLGEVENGYVRAVATVGHSKVAGYIHAKYLEEIPAYYGERGDPKPVMSVGDIGSFVEIRRPHLALPDLGPEAVRDPRRATSVCDYERTRELDLDWNEHRDLFKKRPGARHLAYIRHYFLNSWSANKWEAAIRDKLVATDAQGQFEWQATTQLARIAHTWDNKEKKWSFANAENAKLLIHGDGARVYLVKPRRGANVSFDTEAAFEDAWLNGIDAVQLIVCGSTTLDDAGWQTAAEVMPEMESVDSSTNRLMQRAVDAVAVEQAVASLRDWKPKIIENADSLVGSSADQVAGALRGVLRLKRLPIANSLELQSLRAEAQELGVRIFLSGTDVADALRPVPDVDKPATEAKLTARPFPFLTRTKIETARWQVEHSRGKSRWVTQHSELYKGYEIIEEELPWRKAERALIDKGYKIVRAELSSAGYVDVSTGETLTSVMERCEWDERMRLRLAVMIPEYEQSTVLGRVLRRYHIIQRPLPGVVPIAEPTFHVAETVSYRILWAGLELGPLVGSTNLAAGEKRRLKVAREASREQKTARRESSLSEEADAFGSDIARDIEHEVRAERETTNDIDANVTLSILPFSFGAKASSRTRSEDFKRSYSKVVERATSNFNRRRRVEISSETNEASSERYSSEMSFDVENPNMGCTMNVYLFEVRNLHRGFLHVEPTRFVIMDNIEVIAGTTIVQPRFINIDVNRQAGNVGSAAMKLLEDLANEMRLPYSGTNATDAETKLQALLKTRASEVLAEYGAGSIEDQHDLSLASDALYMDVILGPTSALEPYSELTRAAELDRRRAEIGQVTARAYRRLGEAMRDFGSGPRPPFPKIVPATDTITLGDSPSRSSWVCSLESTKNERSLRLLPPAPTDGGWELLWANGTRVVVPFPLSTTAYETEIARDAKFDKEVAAAGGWGSVVELKHQDRNGWAYEFINDGED